MTRVILALLLVLAPLVPATAEETYSDPKALVQAIYDAYRPGAPKGDPTAHYSSRLKGIVALAEDTAHVTNTVGSELDPVADPTFNPFLPDDSALLFDLAVGEPARLDGRAVVTVTYHNFDQPRLLAISLVEEDGGWKVDDVASMGSDVPWLLSWALAADPYAM
ncbi:MAG: hypothetical protein EOP20_01345 [Hyphomicrobiales bacterium]|nr:MAG: hypothetical protein EOP20_01345 [Hyphomicrobiales bacterium]